VSPRAAGSHRLPGAGGSDRRRFPACWWVPASLERAPGGHGRGRLRRPGRVGEWQEASH
jgi:hypothetical protein